MANNQFVAKNGLISKSDVIVSGSITASNGIFGTSSWAQSSITSSIALSINPTATASYANNALSSSYGISSSFADQSIYSVSTLAPTGFPNLTDSVINWDSASYKLSISASATSYKIYSNGNQYTKTTPEEVTIPTTRGLDNFIYFDKNTLLLTSSISAWSLLTGDVPVSVIYVDGLGNGFVSEERHGIQMDKATHAYLHSTIGARYVSGFTGTFPSASGAFTVTEGTFRDEDLVHSTTTILSESKISYYSASLIISSSASSSLWNGRSQYNNPTLGTFVAITAINRFGAYFLYAVNSNPVQFITVMGQRVDTSLANAQANNTPDKLVLGNFPFTEAKLLYRLIVNGDQTVINATDYRAAQYAGNTAYTPTSHGTLTGLQNDDHLQYLLLAGRTGGQTITDQITVTGITSSLYGSSSYALSASWAPQPTVPDSVVSASWASSSISASYAPVEPDYSSSISLVKQDTLTNTLYTITASLATSASYYPSQIIQTTVESASWVSASVYIENSQTASYILPSNIADNYSSSISSQIESKENTLTNQLYTITASLATSASYYPSQITQITVDSASWVSASVYIENAQTASYITADNIAGDYSSSVSSQLGSKEPTLTNQLYVLTASLATSASYYPAFPVIDNVLSASYASSSVSSSYALSASWSPQPNIPDSVASASWASSSISASYAPVEPDYSSSISTVKQDTLTNTLYIITASLATSASYYPAFPVIDNVLSSSWASSSISASYAPAGALIPRYINKTLFDGTKNITIGALNWTPVFYQSMSYGNTVSSFNRSGGADGDIQADVQSSESYVRDFYCSFKATSNNSQYTYVGLTDDPTLHSVVALNYSFWLDASGNVYIIETSVSRGIVGTYTSNSLFNITYDGTNVKYYLDGTVVRSIARSPGLDLHLCSMMYYAVNTEGIKEVEFGPIPKFAVSSSYALSASWAPQPTVPDSVASASWASSSISASYAPVEPDYSSSISLVKQNTLTNTIYTLTASLATSASYYPTQVIQTTVLSSSWVSASVLINSASYANTSSWAVSASYSTGSVLGYGINNIVILTESDYNLLPTQSISTIYIISSSSPINPYTASYSLNAASALSSSYALTASYALNGGGSGPSSYLSGSAFVNSMIYATASTFTYGSGSVVAHRTALKIVEISVLDYTSLVSTDPETLYIVT